MHVANQNPRKDFISMTDKASTLTYISSGMTAVWGFITSQEFGILAGVLIALAGFLVNCLYKQREMSFKQADERRKQELHEATMQAMATSSSSTGNQDD